MKITKRILPLLIVIVVLLFVGMGCSIKNKATVKAVITEELDLLKNLDSDTAQKYISYKTLFPDATENEISSSIVQEVFSIFFQDFNYKILNIDVDNANDRAVAKLRLTTPDVQTLAKDYVSARLEFLLRKAVNDDSQNTEDITCSTEECYQIMYELLTNGSYKSVKTEGMVELQNTDRKKDQWEIISNSAFENDLVGGLLTYLSDTDLLSPEETLSVYFQTLKHLTPAEMSDFLGIESILNSSDAIKNDIASALVEKVHTTFDYEILNCTVDGYTASIETNITTFDSDSVLSSYELELETYMDTPEAVYDGFEKRYEKSVSMLLEKIENCETVVTKPVTFQLINDGTSWKFDDKGHILGEAIFGILNSASVEVS